jgi:Histidine kinase-, DNA gyrase B-, and HSP90-like ATPase
MQKYKAEIAQPNPRSIINSYRSFGYNLSTAIADIIDNSISANANKIEIIFKWDGKNSYITICDNGNGMKLEELVIAMTPGSKDPETERNANDLGRFGLGLKTASFSQCKRLTVITKKKDFHILKRCWDIDFINKEEKWVLLDFVSNSFFIEYLDIQTSGTLVLWENLDRIVGDSSFDNDAVKNAFYEELSRVTQHLSLVFHRFIESKNIKIIVNNLVLEPWNPFLLNLVPKPEMGQIEILQNNVEVTYFILPHMSKISHENYEKSGGPLGWYQQQGFYIYRGDRLLVAGDWLGIEKKREYSKLARIAVNFPNTGDFEWNLDIKKSTAMPPIEIRKDLGRVARIAIMKSAKIYNWRGQKSISSEFSSSNIAPLWVDEKNREGIKKYKINRKHPIISSILSNRNILLSKALNLLEENVPIELIIGNQNEDPSYHELEKNSDIPSDELISLGVELFQIYKAQGITENLAKQQIMQAMPFNLFPLINDYLK